MNQKCNEEKIEFIKSKFPFNYNGTILYLLDNDINIVLNIIRLKVLNIRKL